MVISMTGVKNPFSVFLCDLCGLCVRLQMNTHGFESTSLGRLRHGARLQLLYSNYVQGH